MDRLQLILSPKFRLSTRLHLLLVPLAISCLYIYSRHFSNHKTHRQAVNIAKMTSTPRSAGERVAATFELLEQILVDTIDQATRSTNANRLLRSVLASQRVSRAFRDTIANSPNVQRGLWFAAPTVSATGRTSNPMIYFEEINLGDGTTLIVQPALWSKGLIIDMSRRGRVLPNRESVISASQHASWRRMYLSKQHIINGVRMSSGLFSYKVEGNFENSTVGQLFDAVI